MQTGETGVTVRTFGTDDFGETESRGGTQPGRWITNRPRIGKFPIRKGAPAAWPHYGQDVARGPRHDILSVDDVVSALDAPGPTRRAFWYSTRGAVRNGRLKISL